MNEATEAERTLRWILKKIEPAAYVKHHPESVLEHLYQRPKEDEHNEF